MQNFLRQAGVQPHYVYLYIYKIYFAKCKIALQAGRRATPKTYEYL